MSLPAVFRLSFYLTMALACVYLGSAEFYFLGWMWIFLGATLVLVALAYRAEGHWALSARAANGLGLVIAISSVLWLLANLLRDEETLLIGGYPWPTVLLPYVGPLLMVLFLIKLFRPKVLADFWTIQTLGLMMVTLACVLAGDPLFGLILVLYLAALLWSLALFYLLRAQALCRGGTSGQVPLFASMLAPKANYAPLPWRFLGLGRVSAWTVAVLFAGIGLFLIVPRQGNWQWSPHKLSTTAKQITRTGLDKGIDLNRTGKVELSEGPAFEVVAHDAQGLKHDLPPDLYWPVEVLDHYQKGHWDNTKIAPQFLQFLRKKSLGSRQKSIVDPFPDMPHPRTPPTDLADQEYYLFFQVRLGATGGLPLAEPVLGNRLGLCPHHNDRPAKHGIFFRQKETGDILYFIRDPQDLYQYGQVVPKLSHADRVPAGPLSSRYVFFLTEEEVPDLIDNWVRDLLTSLPGLNDEERSLETRPFFAWEGVPKKHHAQVARALCRYLAYSGEFTYNLTLRRQDTSLDPVVDFLLNVKEGHCERYAAGLTLMLRALGIPARVVRGYHGHEPQGNGTYFVRQNQAHSWVQVLVPSETSAGWDWLTLDPTPFSETASSSQGSWLNWALENLLDADKLWRNFVMEYNADMQAQSFQALWLKIANGKLWLPLMFLATLLVATWLGYRLVRRLLRPAFPATGAPYPTLAQSGAAFYALFLHLVARHLRLEPCLGQTPLEFAGVVADRLGQLESIPTFSALPGRLVDCLYRVRFGGQDLTETEQLQVRQEVAGLEQILTKR